jgi:Holliday junction DNA helicase RuvA
MIAYLEGKLAVNSPTHLVVDVAGVGFFIHIPLSSYDASRGRGETLRILTHLHVREDSLTIYGFATEAERGLFELLISVSGIGPPLAQKILSGVQIRVFRRLVASEDAGGLTQIKGIGPKLARRLVLELKDRIGDVPDDDVREQVSPVVAGRAEEAAMALAGLGVPQVQARSVVTHVVRDQGNDVPVEEIIREALRRL